MIDRNKVFLKLVLKFSFIKMYGRRDFSRAVLVMHRHKVRPHLYQIKMSEIFLQEIVSCLIRVTWTVRELLGINVGQ